MPLPKTWALNEALGSSDLNAQFVYCNDLVPVGACFAFFDYNGKCTINSAIFKYMNGDTVVDASSPINGEILTDMSNRYLVGFGTEGGKDIGTASWSVTPVGNKSHTNSHYHAKGTFAGSYSGTTTTTGSTHSHAVSDAGHAHSFRYQAPYVGGSGSYYHSGDNGYYSGYNNTASRSVVSATTGISISTTSSAHTHTYSGSVTFSGNVGATAGSNGDSSFSIQVRSIPCRWIIRYK